METSTLIHFARKLMIMAGVLVLLSQSGRGDETTVSKADPAQIATLIQQLGSPIFEDREAARIALRTIGDAAGEQLLEARNHSSAEIRARSSALLRQIHDVPLRQAFQKFAAQADAKLDLEEGMWLISKILNKDVHRVTLARQLDEIATAVRKKLGEGVEPKTADPEKVIAALREVMFTDLEFIGTLESLPAHSSLDLALKNKRGMPILISHIAVAIGRRLEVPLVGIPSQAYTFKYDGQRAPEGFAKKDIFVDTETGLVTPGRGVTEPQSSRDDLVRMLYNLERDLFNRDEVALGYLAIEFRTHLRESVAVKPE